MVVAKALPAHALAMRRRLRSATLLSTAWRAHWPLAVVLVVAVFLRVLSAVAFRPALFYPDSNGYIEHAFLHAPFAFGALRPSGYSAIIRALSLAGRDLAVITSLQHVASLTVGVLTYLLARRAGARRILATLASGMVLLDAYGIALSQHILSEAFFGLMVVGALFFATRKKAHVGLIATVIAGLLLSLATLTRPVALAVLPCWLAYLALRTRRPVVVVVAVLAATIPLLGYAAVWHSRGGPFALTQSDGWFLYGRVGQIVDCRGLSVDPTLRPLCVTPSEARTRGPNYWLWDHTSPVNARLGPLLADFPNLNERLKGFSLAMVWHRPLPYTDLVGKDTLKALGFGHIGTEPAVTFSTDPAANALIPHVEEWYPGFRPRAHPLSGVMRSYERIFHIRRGMLGLSALFCIGALALVLFRRPRHRDWDLPVVGLLTASGLALIVLPAVTAGSEVRYGVPAAPLLFAAAAIGAEAFVPHRYGES